MIRRTNFKIAVTHLSSRVKQTVVAILSVTFGISMYVAMNSFMTGVNDTQTKLAFSTLAHIHIYNGVKDINEVKTDFISDKNNDSDVVLVQHAKVIKYTEGIKNSVNILNIVKQYTEVEAVTSQVNLNVFFRKGATKLNGQLSGVEVDNENKLFNSSEYIIDGSWEALKYSTDAIVLGVGLAKRLNVKTGDNIQIMTADGITKNFKIVGLVKFTIAAVDNTKAFTKINTTRQLTSENLGYATDIQINIKNYKETRALAAKLRNVIPEYNVETWQQNSGQLEAASELRDIIAVSVSIAILIVAGFGIYNIMNMTVNEKMKEIAILKALGFGGRDIVEVFLLQSVVIGILGGLIGIIIGYAISVLISHVPFQIATLKTLPIVYQVKDYIYSFILGFVATFFAGYLPSRRASKVDPVSIIRAN